MRDVFGTDPERRRERRWPHPATVGARLIMVALVASLSVYVTQNPANALWAALLAVIGIPATLAPHHRILGPLSRVAEVVVTALAADVIVAHATPGNELFRGGGAAGAILPYL